MCSWHIVTFLPREYHGQRSLAGYSPWGRKESDTIEWLSHSFPTPPTCSLLLFIPVAFFLLQSITLYVTEINILKQKLDYGNPLFQNILWLPTVCEIKAQATLQSTLCLQGPPTHLEELASADCFRYPSWSRFCILRDPRAHWSLIKTCYGDLFLHLSLPDCQLLISLFHSHLICIAFSSLHFWIGSSGTSTR